jgi:FlaA1/EpsC-like NDP-sugar epimerase
MFTTMVDSYMDRLRKEFLMNKKTYNWTGGQDVDIKMDHSKLVETFSGKKIVVIGGTNHLGIEFLRNVARMDPQKLILLDKYESYLVEALNGLSSIYPKEKIQSYLYDTDFRDTAEPIFFRENPQIIIHMGTRKFASAIEINPVILVKENIFKSWDLMELAEQTGCELLTMLSSIGVGRPKNLVESTLRLSEIYFQSYFQSSETKGIILRLCNLIENRGSLVQNIQSKLREGKKLIHLNHPEEKKYFMTVSKAAKLLLLTLFMGLNSHVNGSIYVPALNGPVKILELVKLILEDLGLDPEKDVQFEFASRGPAEEWEEKILFDGQIVKATEDENLKMIWSDTFLSRSQVKKEVEEFRYLIKTGDHTGIEKKVKDLLSERLIW